MLLVRIRGFDPERIAIVATAFRFKAYSLANGDWRNIQVLSNRHEWNGRVSAIADEGTFHFQLHFGWKGHIERNSRTAVEKTC
jgi:hypothetical protein